MNKDKEKKDPFAFSGVSGLGDAVKIVAQPIAKVIDAAIGTDVQNCSACERRRQQLNEKFPINAKKSTK